jgi:hypothetical protein
MYLVVGAGGGMPHGDADLVVQGKMPCLDGAAAAVVDVVMMSVTRQRMMIVVVQ